MKPILLNKRATMRVVQGYPWIFRSDIENVKNHDDITPGSWVHFVDPKDQVLATGYLNPRCQLMGRVLIDGRHALDTGFFTQAFETARVWRENNLGQSRYCRLVHAESDGLPGLIVDRFGDVIVCQTNTAGMELLKPEWLPALIEVFKPATIIFKDDSSSRKTEGLAENWSVAHGSLPDKPITITENGTQFSVDVKNGQKTGWFYDQRPHRQWIAEKAQGKTMLDVFCHTGGFGVTAAKHGAASVTFVDSSAPAMQLVKQNMSLNDLKTPCVYEIGKAFDVMDKLKQQESQFDIVCIDPPAFVKSKNDLSAGLNGYMKLARQAALLTKPNGLLFFASCSSHPTLYELQNAVQQGFQQAKRAGSLAYYGTAGLDHPQHPLVPETGYLKALAFRIS